MCRLCSELGADDGLCRGDRFIRPDRVHSFVDLRKRPHFDDGDEVELAENVKDFSDAGYLRDIIIYRAFLARHGRDHCNSYNHSLTY